LFNSRTVLPAAEEVDEERPRRIPRTSPAPTASRTSILHDVGTGDGIVIAVFEHHGPSFMAFLRSL
jgi:hypothetical protein